MTADALPSRWLLVRQRPLVPEEQQVLAALRALAAERGVHLMEALLGDASYEVEGVGARGRDILLLEEERRGRGLVVPPGVRARSVSEEELVRHLFTSEKVIQLP
jgi:hypothetical protein